MKRLFLITLLFATVARASEDGALSLSPAVIMLRGEFGQSATQTLRLVNTTSRPFEFDLVAKDVVVRDGKRVFADAGATPGSIAATAVFSQRRVAVPAGQSVAVTMTITLPQSTAVRAVVALFRGTNKVMSGTVPMTASLGSLLTFTTTGAVEMTATPLTVQPQSATTNLAAWHDCANAGHEPFVAKGVLAVLDARGTLVGKAELKPHRLLPGESARLGAEYAGELAPGRYKLVLMYDYDGQTLTKSAEVEIR